MKSNVQLMAEFLQAEFTTAYQIRRRDLLIRRLEGATKRDLGISQKRFRELGRILDATDPVAALHNVRDPRCRMTPVDALAEAILGRAARGSNIRDIRRAIGCRTELVTSVMHDAGQMTGWAEAIWRTRIAREPTIDVSALYLDDELHLAVIEHSQLRRLGINVEDLCVADPELVIPSETWQDQQALVPFELALVSLRMKETCFGAKIAAERRQELLSGAADTIARHGAVILYHVVSGRSQQHLRLLRAMFPDADLFCECEPALTGCLLEFMAQPSLTRMGAGFFPSLRAATVRIDDFVRRYDLKNAVEASWRIGPFLWRSKAPDRDFTMRSRIEGARELRTNGIALSLHATTYRHYTRRHRFPTNHSAAGYSYWYSDGILTPDKLTPPKTRPVTAVRPIDSPGMFSTCAASSHPAADSVWDDDSEGPSSIKVWWPDLQRRLFLVIARRHFAETVRDVADQLERTQNPSVANLAAFWIRRPLDVLEKLNKVRSRPKEQAMAVGIALIIFGPDLLLREMTETDRSRCRKFAGEVNAYVLEHVAHYRDEVINRAKKGSLLENHTRLDEVFNESNEELFAGKFLIIREVLLEARRAFANRVRNASRARVALLSRAAAERTIRTGREFEDYWPVIGVPTDELVTIAASRLVKRARRLQPRFEIVPTPDAVDLVDGIIRNARRLTAVAEKRVLISKEKRANLTNRIREHAVELKAQASGAAAFMEAECMDRIEEADRIAPNIRREVTQMVNEIFETSTDERESYARGFRASSLDVQASAGSMNAA